MQVHADNQRPEHNKRLLLESTREKDSALIFPGHARMSCLCTLSALPDDFGLEKEDRPAKRGNDKPDGLPKRRARSRWQQQRPRARSSSVGSRSAGDSLRQRNMTGLATVTVVLVVIVAGASANSVHDRVKRQCKSEAMTVCMGLAAHLTLS